MDDETARIKWLRDTLENGLVQRVPNSVVNGDPLERLPNTANIAFEDIEGGHGILHLLDREGVVCSSGSACTSGSAEPSHVLRAMKMPHGAVRFSFARDNGQGDVDRVLEVLPSIVERLRHAHSSGSNGWSAEDLQGIPGLSGGRTGVHS